MTASATPDPPYPTRFGWGLRILLGVLLFDMVFRSLSVTFPWGKWSTDLDLRTMPRRLPTLAEIDELSREATADNPTPVRDDVLLAADSLWDYLRPWPDAAQRSRLRTSGDKVKWPLVWLTSRLEFAENVVGINQEWPMFSPSVSRQHWLPRARLVYADGATRIVRGRCDPEDLLRFGHWNEEKVLDYELKVKEGKGWRPDCTGYCNLLRHRYATNEAGAELKTIYLFMVRYHLPPPGADAAAWLREQSGPPASQVLADFFEYDVAANRGTSLRDRYD